MLYPLVFRKKVIQFVKKRDMTKKDICKIFGIGKNTLFDWIKRDKNGELAPSKNTFRKPQKLNPIELKNYVEQNPDLTIKQIADQFNVWPQAVFYRLNKLKYTYKKRLSLQREMSRKERKVS